MRTSNKILTGLFLVTILVFCSLFTLVRVKYANGNTVKRDPVNDWSDVHRLQGTIKSISISELNNIMIIPSDSARLEIWKGGEEEVKWRLENGVLYVEADTSRKDRNSKTQMAYGHIELFIPNVDSIHAVNSHIVVKNIADPGALKPVYNFQLSETDLAFENGQRDADATFYDAIRVNAGQGSLLRFDGFIHVNTLEANLQNSRLEEGEAFFGKLSIQTDSVSTFSLKGHNLRKATITSTE
ncbi:hypothetical protein D3H65_18255 [Paraflavitalea soli]|uniref:Uncharacterized protein n=1 Tax=Paraflavitalea soli TaxID=2315862 RepID=A0A3B7MPS8_9BACT|nr:hypothetical protein [Paraflavitalea soli]AXY75807.1 hypothetical protein D3H65_18255 [Paraflavitalea soli]